MLSKARIALADYSYASRMPFSSEVPAEYAWGNAAPVVLLPGVYEPWHFLRPAADRLNALGHPVHVVRALGRNAAPVATAAALAQRYVDEHDLRGVQLVAHSKGGLIGKHMMLLDDADGRLDRMVAIATPFGGSSWSRFMPNPALRAFRPTERTLAMLTANAETNSRITSICPAFDPHIPEGSMLPGATNVRVPVSGHFVPLAAPSVLDAVVAAVTGTAPTSG